MQHNEVAPQCRCPVRQAGGIAQPGGLLARALPYACEMFPQRCPLDYRIELEFCLSKGLSAPVGSVVVGSADFIWRARRARKLLGGGLRQAGVLAAAGLVALQDDADGTIARLAEDHRRARVLAEGLSAQQGIVSPGHLAQPVGERLDPGRVTTNFVLFAVEGGPTRRAAYLAALRERGVGMVAYPHGQIRAVTHRGIDDADIEAIIEASASALAATRP